MILTYNSTLDGPQSLDILCDLALSHSRKGGEPGRAITQMILSRDFKGLCDYEVDYEKIDSVDTVLNVRQALAFFTKLEFLDIGVDKESVARKNFISAEGACLKTNRLLNMTASEEFFFPSDVERVLIRAERKIADVLGPVPALSELEYLFGPGATTSVKRRSSCSRTKLSAVPSCSTNMIPLLDPLMECLPHYCDLHSTCEGERTLLTVELHHGRMVFVPKNAKTYRAVRTEPTLNALVQSAFGRFIAQKLLRVGQSIHDQARNQRLAMEGSLLGNLATLDLSNASDSICTELVARLLPYEWFAALSLCRTPTVSMSDQVLHLHQFSSMGNGFTFPLQTLIFWALCKSCSELSDDIERRVSVYGDDIVVGINTVPLVQRVFDCVGFSLNKGKSYWSGPFRESCGADYYKGINVRPFYARSFVSGEFLFQLHNFYKRAYDDDRACRVLQYIEECDRIYGPDRFGDGHLLGDWTPKPLHRDRGYGGFCFETFTRKPVYHTQVLPGDRVLPLYTIYEREFAPLDELGFRAETAPIPFRGIGEAAVAMLGIPGGSAVRRIKIYTLSA